MTVKFLAEASNVQEPLIEFDLKLTNFKSDALPTALCCPDRHFVCRILTYKVIQNGEHYNAHVFGYSNKFKQAKKRIEKRETKTQAKKNK